MQSLQWQANFLCLALARTQFIALDLRANALTAAPWSCMVAAVFACVAPVRFAIERCGWHLLGLFRGV